MTIAHTDDAPTTDTTKALELLIKEARAASRRRRLRWFAAFTVVALVASLIVAISVGVSKPT